MVSLRSVRSLSRVLKAASGAEMKSALRHHVTVLLGGIISECCGLDTALPQAVAKAIRPGLFALLDCCGKHELQHLHSKLNAPSRALLKLLHQRWLKDHKFHGQV
jgi:hypothetical protein